jgi:hypothetical protein
MKKNLLLLLLASAVLQAQVRKQISYGLFAGANNSKMNNIAKSIIPQGIYSGFTATEKDKYGFSGGVFANWKYPFANISIYTEASYSKQSTDMNYSDTKGLNYKIGFNYNYLNLGTQFKYYPVDNWYVGAGPYWAVNLTPKELKYTSNAAEVSANTGLYIEPDSLTEDKLKEAFSGKNHFYMAFSTGYEFENHLIIGARYHLGLSDAIRTEENGFRYSEQNNRIRSFSLFIGYSFDFDDVNNF